MLELHKCQDKHGIPTLFPFCNPEDKANALNSHFNLVFTTENLIYQQCLFWMLLLSHAIPKMALVTVTSYLSTISTKYTLHIFHTVQKK